MDTITRFMQRKWFYDLAVFIVGWYFRIVYGVSVYGSDNVPQEGGVVVTCNHISYFDPTLVGTTLGREVHFMAKKELFEDRYFRALVLGLRAYPVDRERNDLNAVKGSLRRLKDGIAIGIFLQGTRNRSDAKAFNGAAFLAQRAGAPLLPTALWREGRRLCIAYGQAIHPQGRSKEEVQQLTEQLMQAISDLLPEEKRPGALQELEQAEVLEHSEA